MASARTGIPGGITGGPLTLVVDCLGTVLMIVSDGV